MAEKPSRLDSLIDEAVLVHNLLETLNADRKLTYDSFLAEALDIADIQWERLDEVERIVAEKDGTEEIQRFVRSYAMKLREPNFPSPPRDPSRPMRIFGSEELPAQAAQHGLRSGELQCLAIKVTADRFGPETFGPVVDRRDHEKKTAELRERLASLYEEMRAVMCGADLDLTTDGLFAEEVKRGLCKASFKRSPGIGPHMGDWPRELVTALALPAPKRERIKKVA